MPREHLLHRLAKTANPAKKAVIRRNILARIAGAPLKQVVRHGSSPLTMTQEERFDLRDQVLARIARPKTAETLHDARRIFAPTLQTMQSLRDEILDRISFWQPAPAWHRFVKPIAVTAAFALMLRIAPALFIATPGHAISQNILLPTEGVVSITDGAEWSTVTEELVLDHPLTLRTGPESAATIIIRDDAVLRLSENTEITLREAAFDTSIKGPLARVSYGQLWATGLLSEALFTGNTIVLPQGMLALKDGSISLLADPQQSTIQVFHRFARVLPTDSEPIHLIEGDQLSLPSGNSAQRHLITNSMREEEWVLTNLARDAVHRSYIAERKQEHAETVAGILPTSSFYSLKRASEQVDLWLTLGSKSRQEKKLQHAETRLNEAVALLKAGEVVAAESPLAAYRDAIREFASISEEEARELLNASLLDSSTTVASALPHSKLYPAKKAILEVASEVESSEIPMAQVDLFLLSDALLGIESLIAQGELTRATIAMNGIEGAAISVLENQELDGMDVTKDGLQAVKTILRSIAFSLEQAKETTKSEHVAQLETLQGQMESISPTFKTTTVAIAEKPMICMTVRESIRRTNQFLADVYTYQTPRAQRNEVLRQIASLPDCPQSGRILSKVMNKVPVFTRSFVWDAIQKVGTEI